MSDNGAALKFRCRNGGGTGRRGNRTRRPPGHSLSSLLAVLASGSVALALSAGPAGAQAAAAPPQPGATLSVAGEGNERLDLFYTGTDRPGVDGAHVPNGAKRPIAAWRQADWRPRRSVDPVRYPPDRRLCRIRARNRQPVVVAAPYEFRLVGLGLPGRQAHLQAHRERRREPWQPSRSLSSHGAPTAPSGVGACTATPSLWSCYGNLGAVRRPGCSRARPGISRQRSGLFVAVVGTDRAVWVAEELVGQAARPGIRSAAGQQPTRALPAHRGAQWWRSHAARITRPGTDSSLAIRRASPLAGTPCTASSPRV